MNQNSKLAKNTLLLYFRMFITMIVSLYTSRVVLLTLGISDYGIYNVVGGVTSLMGIINSSMINSTQRFLTFEIGKQDKNSLNRVFNMALSIHILICVLVVLLAETIGLWFLNNKMTFPADRLWAANWVYQCTIISMVISILSSPYNALLIAHERMSAFAYISIVEVGLKLLIVFALQLMPFDKLIVYGILFALTDLTIRLIYGSYCSKHFSETKRIYFFDKSLFVKMTSFASWSLFGNCAVVLSTVGVNIILNMFLGPIVNAARGVAVQVQGAVSKFSVNFQTAVNPQIIKSYAQHEMNYMYRLVCSSSKISFMLIYIISLPIIVETGNVLSLWLKNVPDYSVPFVRLMLCISIVDAMAGPMMTSASATGKIKQYQAIVGGIQLVLVPASYLLLYGQVSPVSVFAAHLFLSILALVSRMFLLNRMIDFNIRSYFVTVMCKCFLLVIITFPLVYLAKKYICSYQINILVEIVIISCISFILSIVCIYLWGLNKQEKDIIKKRIKKVIKIGNINEEKKC